MAQHDYVIANKSRSAFRADLNNALAASVSTNSGSSAPSTTYAFMLWADTTSGIFKIRNASNNNWVSLFKLDGTDVHFCQLLGSTDNTICTVTGADQIQGEANLTFNGSTLTIGSNGSSFAENNVKFKNGGTAYIDHASDGQDIHFRTSSGGEVNKTGMILKSNGNLAFANGNGIDFSAWTNTGGTGTANKHEILNSYEQGTFTPYLKPHDSTTGQVAGSGQYVRIGHGVTMRFSFYDVDTTSIPDGKTIAISGLPFTTDHDGVNGYFTSSVMMTERINTRLNNTFYSNDNNSVIYGIYANDGGQWSGWQTNDFNNNANTRVHFNMFVVVD